MNTNLSNDIPDMPDLANLALQFAQSQVGTMEDPPGSNRGKMVDEYLKAVGLRPGYAWCQAFVYWCYNQAAGQMKRLNPVVKTAGVYDCWNRSDGGQNGKIARMLKEKALLQPGLLKPGDQFIMTFGRATGHTGLIERVEKAAAGKNGDVTLIHTIEGNSNDNGSREGYAVVRRQRYLDEKAIRGFIRYT